MLIHAIILNVIINALYIFMPLYDVWFTPVLITPELITVPLLKISRLIKPPLGGILLKVLI